MKYFLYKSGDKRHIEVYYADKSSYVGTTYGFGDWKEIEISKEVFDFIFSICKIQDGSIGIMYYENRKI